MGTYYEDASYDEALVSVTQHEFSSWRTGLPRYTHDDLVMGQVPVIAQPGLTPMFPHPADVGGLPDGWQVRWQARSTIPDSAIRVSEYEMFLFERDAGGWGVVFARDDYGPQVSRTSLWPHISMTVAGLYARAVKVTDGGYTHGVEHHIRDYFLSRYNLGDPAEEAEATLVGLGARVTVFPRLGG